MKNEKEGYVLESMLTGLEPRYESKQELQIARMLDQYGLPFFYKQPTIVLNQESSKNEVWYPTFTLPQYGCSIIDYIDNPAEKTLLERIGIYRYNQIPAVVLGPKNLDEPNWQQTLYEKLQQETSRTSNLLCYMNQ